MNLIEIRWHGRGGQGVVTVSDLLARAAVSEGKYAQHFPEFGPERSGAPVKAYTRISDEPIDMHAGIYNPDIVIVIDPRMVREPKSYIQGLKEGGKLLLNSGRVAEEVLNEVKDKRIELYSVDAMKISSKIGRTIFNVPMLGALVKVAGLVSLESVKKALEARFSGDVLDMNIKIMNEAYQEVKKIE